MNDAAYRFHDKWLGMVQPYEGLVVSVPVLVEAQCMEQRGRPAQQALLSCLAKDAKGNLYAPNLALLFQTVLELGAERFDYGGALPDALRLFVPEGKQTLRPSMALKRRVTEPQDENPGATSTKAAPGVAAAELSPAALAGQAYLALVWDVPFEVELDKPEAVTGPWEYPAQRKFERLLRECRVPIGLLSNGREVRLVYAPHGESSGWLSFRMDAMTAVGGRDVLDAFVMLTGKQRWFGVAQDAQLPALLQQSRRQQANVTNELSQQVFQALEELLAGFVAAGERDPGRILQRVLEEGDGTVYAGLLTVLLRLVFVLYCEDKSLLPVESELYAQNYSVLGLYDQLEQDQARFPDSMDRRYGAYARLVMLFRAVYLGVDHGPFHLPPRHGDLFEPNRYPFLEGWEAGSAPMRDPEAQARVALPAISDGTIYRVLKKLIVLGGQRLSYRALDVEQIGSVYEALMGFDVERLAESGGVRIKLGSKRGAARVWVEAARLLSVTPSRRAAWLQDELGFDKGLAAKIGEAVKSAKSADEALTALEPLSGRKPERVSYGAVVIQPGPERRRTSSHYTPRSLSEPIVKQAIDPLLRAMGDAPSSEALLNLVICDPAMGSGAFLVAACRYLADHVVAAWTREAAAETGALKGIGPQPVGSSKTKLELLNDAHEDVVNHARRLVAQRCLYGVDKNPYAVQLARLSLWLVTMAKGEPFTFVDHALRHGDSLVGLDFDQIKAFHWKVQKGANVETTSVALRNALDEAISIRKQILELAADGSASAQNLKEGLLRDSLDATRRVRLIADLIVGAFFGHSKDKDRETERKRRLDRVQLWLGASDLHAEAELEAELLEMQSELRRTQVPFHWMLEFPEVFYLERPDPLDAGRVNGRAMVEAVIGNPPFAGKNGISESGGECYLPWLQSLNDGAHGNADLCAHFFRRAATLLGEHGTVALIATNTIGQGDTRATGIQYLVNRDFSIAAATTDMPWPGDAAVTVSIVNMGTGKPAQRINRVFNGRGATFINSRLKPRPERADPIALGVNASLSFQGSIVLGMGFTLTSEDRRTLVASSPKNAERIFPYLGGEEVNTSPTQAPHRHVIDFGQMTLEDAERWPELLSIVREKVKPERDRGNQNTPDGRDYKVRWWQYAKLRESLYEAIAPLSRCLVTSRHQPHLVFSFQPTDRVFSEALYVFPLEANTPFAVLQSRIHERWARLLSSTMEDRLRYAASDCFETFPFPAENPRSVIPELEAIGERLYAVRAKYMVDTDQGLTKTYNALKHPTCTDERILELRALHEEMDRAVLRAYPKLLGVGSHAPDVVGWSDISVPPFCIATDEDRAALQAFEDEVIDRLFVLNEERAKKEEALGQASKKAKPVGTKASKATKGSPAKRGATKVKTAKTADPSSQEIDSADSEGADAKPGTKPRAGRSRGKGKDPSTQGELDLK